MICSASAGKRSSICCYGCGAQRNYMSYTASEHGPGWDKQIHVHMCVCVFLCMCWQAILSGVLPLTTPALCFLLWWRENVADVLQACQKFSSKKILLNHQWSACSKFQGLTHLFHFLHAVLVHSYSDPDVESKLKCSWRVLPLKASRLLHLPKHSPFTLWAGMKLEKLQVKSET